MKQLLIIALLAITCTANAQVGIGTATPDPSAKLDITSTTQGLLPPRMTGAQRDLIVTPATGLMIYCTNCGNGEPEYYSRYNSWVTFVGTPSSVPTVTSSTGRIWMDRNVGATQVATSSSAINSFGDLYQWGRYTDGHQLRNSITTTTQSGTDQPINGDFIVGNNDWRTTKNDGLWQGVGYFSNNPCPGSLGLRLPTEAEFAAEIATWVSQNSDGAFNSVLKLPLAGFRLKDNGSISGIGTAVFYWTSTVDGASSRDLYFSNSAATFYTDFRANGFSVRCIRN